MYMNTKVKIYFLIGTGLVFVMGCLCGSLITTWFNTHPLLEGVYIQSNSMDIYKSVTYLELIEEKNEARLKECLEWDMDQGLIGLAQYTSSEKAFRRLDDFALQTIKMAKAHRKSFPRRTSVAATDNAVMSVLECKFNPVISPLRD